MTKDPSHEVPIAVVDRIRPAMIVVMLVTSTNSISGLLLRARDLHC